LNALEGCEVVIAGGMGRRMIQDLESAGKEVFITSERMVEKAVKLYLEGQLEHNPEKGCDR
jgi:predicted Fe-Mo cluster-binding NifX family protein